jgi:RNA polymerase sigma-70 factor (ECF subfamily)
MDVGGLAIPASKRNPSPRRLTLRSTSSGVPKGGIRLQQVVRIAQKAKEFDLVDSVIRNGDGDLVEGLRQGSLPAFERLYALHGERMKSIAANLLGSAADAEDAVQETFLKAYRAARSFRAGASVATWLYRILVNACYDQLRGRRRRAEGPLPEPSAPAAFPASERDHPLRLAIESALGSLPERERAAFLLCEVEGFSHREAAEILEVPEATSRTLLFRARRELQRGLAASGAFRPAEAR